MNAATRAASARLETVQCEGPGGREPLPGLVLDGRYELLECVARGAMAAIFRAADRRTGETVAVKIPHAHAARDPGFVERFLREETLGASLEHPALMRVRPADATRSRPYMVMEYVRGETLDARIARQGAIPEAEAAGIAAAVCDALDHLYRRGMVHRDLKPGNIILCADGGLRVIDFGLARGRDTRRLTQMGLGGLMGTPDYIAPEQVRGARGDHRSDLYSLGVILYEMVTGSLPYVGDNPFVVMNARVVSDPPSPRELTPGLSSAMDRVIMHALARDPERRFLAPLAMRRALEPLAATHEERGGASRRARTCQAGLPSAHADAGPLRSLSPTTRRLAALAALLVAAQAALVAELYLWPAS